MNKLLIILSVMLGMILTDAAASNYKYVAGSGVTFGWNHDDCIAVYTPSGTRLLMWATDYDTDAEASFSAYGFTLSSNLTYRAFYPHASTSGNTPETELPMTYDGQKQIYNRSLEHLGAYDYMSVTSTATSELKFNFCHLGCVARFELTMPDNVTLKALTFNGITLELDNIILYSGQKLTAYMMLPAQNLKGKTIELSLTDTNDRVAKMKLAGCDMQAGKCYPLAIECPEFGNADDSGSGNTSGDTPTPLLAKRSGITLEPQTSIVIAKAKATDFLIDTVNILKEQTVLLGDVNGDGEVDTMDAIAVIGYYLNGSTENFIIEAADVNGDGEVDTMDAVAIIGKYLGK